MCCGAIYLSYCLDYIIRLVQANEGGLIHNSCVVSCTRTETGLMVIQITKPTPHKSQRITAKSLDHLSYYLDYIIRLVQANEGGLIYNSCVVSCTRTETGLTVTQITKPTPYKSQRITAKSLDQWLLISEKNSGSTAHVDIGVATWVL